MNGSKIFMFTVGLNEFLCNAEQSALFILALCSQISAINLASLMWQFHINTEDDGQRLNKQCLIF